MLTKSQKSIAHEIARTIGALSPTEQRLVLAYAAEIGSCKRAVAAPFAGSRQQRDV